MLVNKKEVMGDYQNSTWMNIVTCMSTAVLIGLNLVLFYNAIIDVTK